MGSAIGCDAGQRPRDRYFMCRLWSSTVHGPSVPAAREGDLELEPLIHAAHWDAGKPRPVSHCGTAAPRDNALLLGAPGGGVAGDHHEPSGQRHERLPRTLHVEDHRGAGREDRPADEEARNPVAGGITWVRAAGWPAAKRRRRRPGVDGDVSDERVVVRAPRLARENDRVVVVTVADAAADGVVGAAGKAQSRPLGQDRRGGEAGRGESSSRHGGYE